MARTKKEIQVSAHNVSVLDQFRDAIRHCNLSKDEEVYILSELESTGVAAVTASKIKQNLTRLRDKIKRTEEYRLEKELKAKLKQVEKMQEYKTAMVLGVLNTKNAGKQIKALNNIVGLLEGGK